MEAKELRMGNLLLTDYDYLVEVEFIHRNRFDCRECTTGNFVLNGKYKPIPLTEEWIVNFGYEDLIDMAISFCKECKYYGIEITSEDLRKIKVHEAQNLYYALTKKELTIKK